MHCHQFFCPLAHSPFLDTYNLAVSVLGCKALCIVINSFVLWHILHFLTPIIWLYQFSGVRPYALSSIFLFFWHICLSFFLVHFKNCPDYLTTVTAHILSFDEVSATAFNYQKFPCSFFFSLVWWYPLLIFLSTFLLPAFWFFHNFGSSFPTVIFSTIHFEHGSFFNAKFHSYIMDVYSYCLYQSIQLFFSFAESLMSSTFIRWLIFSWDFVNLFPPEHILSVT